MGFLGFLKKNKPKDSDVNLDDVEKKIAGKVTADTPVAPPEEPANIPIPPAAMRDPGFKEMPAELPALETAAEPLDFTAEPPAEPTFDKPPEAHTSEATPELVPLEEPAPESIPTQDSVPELPEEPTPDSHPLDLPDFSDEEIQEFSNISEVRTPHVEEPEEVEETPEPVLEEEDYMPPQTLAPPLPTQTFTTLEEGRFLSSDEHFALTDDILDLRKKLRGMDNLVSDIVTDHTKVDAQLEKIAKNMNTIQERLIHIDGTLFEE